jgi:hypothetical protein
VCVAQAVLGFVCLIYDDSALRSVKQGKTFNGNKLFGTIAAIIQHACSVVFHRGSEAITSLALRPRKEFRSLEALLGPGYCLKAKLGDTFSSSELSLVMAALKRCVRQ